MQAIDDFDRMRSKGYIAYCRLVGGKYAIDDDVVESVSATLNTPTDPRGRCVAEIGVEWVPHFANGALAPRLRAVAGSAKLLALFPEVLAPFFKMRHGELTPDEFVDGLIAVGCVPAPGTASRPVIQSPALTCTACGMRFSPRDMWRGTGDPTAWRCGWCAVPQGADRVGMHHPAQGEH